MTAAWGQLNNGLSRTSSKDEAAKQRVPSANHRRETVRKVILGKIIEEIKKEGKDVENQQALRSLLNQCESAIEEVESKENERIASGSEYIQKSSNPERLNRGIQKNFVEPDDIEEDHDFPELAKAFESIEDELDLTDVDSVKKEWVLGKPLAPKRLKSLVGNTKSIARSARYSKNVWSRLSAVRRLQDSPVLLEVAFNDPDWYVRKEAVNRIAQEDALRTIMAQDEIVWVRIAARRRWRILQRNMKKQVV